MGHSSIYHDNKLMTGICILGVAYLSLALHAYRRLLYLQRHSPDLNTRKLFVMSCFLCCVLRVMSFASIVVLNFGYINVDETLNSEDEDTFLGAAMLVLIDFPNYVIISAYMLVAVVWAEAFLQVTTAAMPVSAAVTAGMPVMNTNDHQLICIVFLLT